MPGDELLELRRLTAVRFVRTIVAALRAGGQPVDEAVLLQEPLDLRVADLHAADVDLRRNQQLGRVARRLLAVDRCVQRLEPVAGLGKGIVLLRVDEQQRQRGFVQIELMDEAIILLPGQVPQQGFALHACVRRQRQIQPPDVHAVRASRS